MGKAGLRGRIAARVAVLFVSVCGRLPLSMARTVGRGVGWLLWCVPRVRKVALANLDLAYKDTLTSAEKRRIARESALNMGIVAAEFGHMPRMTAANIHEYVVLDGVEHVDPDRGGLIIGAHLANWEWMGTAIELALRHVAEVVRPLDEPALNAFVDRTRTASGVATIVKDNAGPQIMRLLREGTMVGVLIDQSPRVSAVPVTFFGEPCWATVAPAMIALRMQVPIYVVTVGRNRQGPYRVTFSPPLPRHKSGNFRHDLVRISQTAQDQIEAAVRANPGQWLWAHRRWKKRPRLEAEWAAKRS